MNKHITYRIEGTEKLIIRYNKKKLNLHNQLFYVSFSSACDTRLTIVDKFLEKFTLSEQEISTLCSSAVPIDNEFFIALDHLKQIHSDCRVLLMTHNQQAG